MCGPGRQCAVARVEWVLGAHLSKHCEAMAALSVLRHTAFAPCESGDSRNRPGHSAIKSRVILLEDAKRACGRVFGQPVHCPGKVCLTQRARAALCGNVRCK